MPRFVTIQLTGVQDCRHDPKLLDRPFLTFYGHRIGDSRIVGVNVPTFEAMPLTREAAKAGTMPMIEVDDRYWYYVLALPNAIWEAGKQPS